MAVAYGVGVNKLTLHVPASVPQPFKDLLADCWKQDPHDRPSFAEILTRLETISNSQFIKTPHESFSSLRDNWCIEIEDMLTDLKGKENELRCRENELTQALMKQKVVEENLRKKEQELLDRELDLLGR